MTERRSDNARRAVVFFLLLAFWLVLSGHYDTMHISLGVVCAALVSVASYDLVPDVTAPGMLRTAGRFIRYIPWLLWEIVLANLHVTYLVLFPRRIHPQVIRLKTSLVTDLARTTLGNSITLTPGTVTLDITNDIITVHALSDKAAADLQSGAMERRVAYIFEPLSARHGPGPEAVLP